MEHQHRIDSEKGSAILLSVFVLFILTMLGLYSSTTSTMDIQIASNDRDYVQVFYGAESGWQVGVSWLDAQYPLPTTSVGLDTSGGSTSFSSAKYASSDSNAIDGVNNYQVTARFDGTQRAPGYSTDYRRFRYTITSTGAGAQNAESQVIVTARKVERVGGY